MRKVERGADVHVVSHASVGKETRVIADYEVDHSGRMAALAINS